jgi:hypothetical protein
MKSLKIFRNQEGKIGYILLWLIGVPIPILILIFLVRPMTSSFHFGQSLRVELGGHHRMDHGYMV